MLHRLHLTSACLIGLFIACHLANHLFIIVSPQQHIAVMDTLRKVYRLPIVELVLLACIAFQVISGLRLVWRRRGQRTRFIEKAQVFSGLYLAYFLTLHVSAVLFGRAWLALDTNLYYGIAGFHVSPFQLYFIPYYFLAVVALFVHLAAAIHWLTRNKLPYRTRQYLIVATMGTGVLLASVMILGFGGTYYSIEVPPEYLSTFTNSG